MHIHYIFISISSHGIILFNSLCSITNQEQQHVYDYVATKPFTTKRDNCPVKKLSSDHDIVMDVKLAYSEEISFTNISTKNLDYKIVDTQSRQIKADDIKMDINPAYVETKFT